MPIIEHGHKGPIVYIFRLRGRAMYVGKGSGYARPFDANHHMAHVRNECDQVEVIPFETHKEAYQRERELIAELRPHYNQKHSTGSNAVQVYQREPVQYLTVPHPATGLPVSLRHRK